jgi:hypothetical protein
MATQHFPGIRFLTSAATSSAEALLNCREAGPREVKMPISTDEA